MAEFNHEQAIKDYARLMEAGPLAENEQELQSLIEQAYAHNLYFDYDREKQTYMLRSSEAPEMRLCPYCNQYHPIGAGEWYCPLTPNSVK